MITKLKCQVTYYEQFKIRVVDAQLSEINEKHSPLYMHVKINFSEGNHKSFFWFLEPFWLQLMFLWVAFNHDKYFI